MTGIFPNATTVGTGTGIYPTDGTPTLVTSPFDGVLKASNAVIGRVVLENPSSALSIANFPAVQRVEVASFPAVQPVSIVNQPGVQDVRITNPPAQQTVVGTVAVSNFPALQEVRLNGDSSVTARLLTSAAHIGSVSVAGPISGTVAISNPTTSVEINNFPSTQAVTGRVEVSNLPATPTAIRVNNDTTQPIPVAIVSGSAGGGGGGFDGVLKASTATIGTVTLGAPVALASGTNVGISGLVGISNFPTSFNIGNLPSTQTVSGTVSIGSLPAVTVSNQFDGALRLGGSTVSTSNRLPVDVAFPATQPVSVAAPLKIDSTTAIRVEVTNPSSGGGSGGTFDGNVTVTSGTISVANFPQTQTVSGTVALAGTPTVNANVTFPTVQTVQVQNPTTSISVSNLPDTQKVAVQGTVPVSFADPVTIANPVTSVAVNNFPTSTTVANPFNGALTLAGQAVSTSNRLPVDVSGSVTLSGAPFVRVSSLPNVELAVNGVNVSASNRYPVEVQFPSTQAVSITGTPAVTVSGTVTTTPTRVGPAVAPMNISGTLSATNTAQQIAGANADRRGGWIQNNSTADLWLNDLGTATIGGSSLKIPAGGYYEFPATGVPTGALSIIGPNMGQAWSGRVW